MRINAITLEHASRAGNSTEMGKALLSAIGRIMAYLLICEDLCPGFREVLGCSAVKF